MNTGEVINHDITIYKGADYRSEYQCLDDTDNVIDLSVWTMTAVLREFPETNECYPFTCEWNDDNFCVTMGHAVTSDIGFTSGVYDIFLDNTLTDERIKLAQGRAKIVPNTTRGLL